jgi:6-phosphogluconolactonase
MEDLSVVTPGPPISADATRWHVYADAARVAQEAAERILAGADRAIAGRGVFRIVLAGGRTPEQAYERLREADTDWTRWEIYFGDERCLPPQDPGRNSTMAVRAWLEHVPILRDRIHPIPAELGAKAAAQAYARVIERARPFDLVLLGMGEDGHTASLFPGRTYAEDEDVHAVHDAPKPPPDRVSLSRRTLGDAREILILVTGGGKREALRHWQAGEPLPVASIQGPGGVDVLLDQAARG